jgi:hypothetical protein
VERIVRGPDRRMRHLRVFSPHTLFRGHAFHHFACVVCGGETSTLAASDNDPLSILAASACCLLPLSVVHLVVSTCLAFLLATSLVETRNPPCRRRNSNNNNNNNNSNHESIHEYREHSRPTPLQGIAVRQESQRKPSASSRSSLLLFLTTTHLSLFLLFQKFHRRPVRLSLPLCLFVFRNGPVPSESGRQH